MKLINDLQIVLIQEKKQAVSKQNKNLNKFSVSFQDTSLRR